MKKNRIPGKNQSAAAANPTEHRGKSPLKIVLLLTLLISVVAGFGAVIAFRSESTDASRMTASRGRVPMPSSSPNYNASAPAKEYIHAGGKLIAVSEPVSPPATDLAVWRLSTGTWYVMDENGTTATQTFGLPTDLPAPGDYDGDGKTDFCVFRPSDGYWYILESGTSTWL